MAYRSTFGSRKSALLLGQGQASAQEAMSGGIWGSIGANLMNTVGQLYKIREHEEDRALERERLTKNNEYMDQLMNVSQENLAVQARTVSGAQAAAAMAVEETDADGDLNATKLTHRALETGNPYIQQASSAIVAEQRALTLQNQLEVGYQLEEDTNQIQAMVMDALAAGREGEKALNAWNLANGKGLAELAKGQNYGFYLSSPEEYLADPERNYLEDLQRLGTEVQSRQHALVDMQGILVGQMKIPFSPLTSEAVFDMEKKGTAALSSLFETSYSLGNLEGQEAVDEMFLALEERVETPGRTFTPRTLKKARDFGLDKWDDDASWISRLTNFRQSPLAPQHPPRYGSSPLELALSEYNSQYGTSITSDGPVPENFQAFYEAFMDSGAVGYGLGGRGRGRGLTAGQTQADQDALTDTEDETNMRRQILDDKDKIRNLTREVSGLDIPMFPPAYREGSVLANALESLRHERRMEGKPPLTIEQLNEGVFDTTEREAGVAPGGPLFMVTDPAARLDGAANIVVNPTVNVNQFNFAEDHPLFEGSVLGEAFAERDALLARFLGDLTGEEIREMTGSVLPQATVEHFLGSLPEGTDQREAVQRMLAILPEIDPATGSPRWPDDRAQARKMQRELWTMAHDIMQRENTSLSAIRNAGLDLLVTEKKMMQYMRDFRPFAASSDRDDPDNLRYLNAFVGSLRDSFNMIFQQYGGPQPSSSDPSVNPGNTWWAAPWNAGWDAR